MFPVEVAQVPLAANPNSPSSASGIPDVGASAHVRPALLVTAIWNFPSTGSPITTPCRRSIIVMQSKNPSGSMPRNVSFHVSPPSVVR